MQVPILITEPAVIVVSGGACGTRLRYQVPPGYSTYTPEWIFPRGPRTGYFTSRWAQPGEDEVL